MSGDFFQYGLLAALAIALLVAAFTDLRRRQIDNWLTAGIALTSPLYWLASGLGLWPGVAIQLGLGIGVFAILAGLFALRMMGGGDVKLLSALALWIVPANFLKLVIIMAIVGGVLTLVFAGWHVIRRQRDRIAIPYGVAIAIGGLWVLGTNYLPVAGQQVGAG